MVLYAAYSNIMPILARTMYPCYNHAAVNLGANSPTYMEDKMRRVSTTVAALLLAIVMAMPVVVMAQPQLEPPIRVEDGVVFVPLRYVVEALGAHAEWEGTSRAAVITREDGEMAVVPIEAVGGFIENGVSWVTIDFINEVIAVFLLGEQEEEQVERIDLTLWDAENFEDVRESMFSTDEAPGVIAVGFIEYMSDNLGARSAFTYRELETAVWIVAELLAMGHDWDNIAVQEFTYWGVHDMELPTFMPLNWNQVTSPSILGVGRDYQLRADRVSQNVVLTIPGQSERKIIVGAHYDSPPYASASDNASGTALLLESAQRMLETEHYYTIVYVFFGSEEVGLIGSFYYEQTLTQQQRDNIVLMVNADVIIEGPYTVFGVGSAPAIDDALEAVMLEALMDMVVMEFEMILAELEAMGIAYEDMSTVLPFDSFEGFVEMVAGNIANMSPEMLLLQAAMLGIAEPVVGAVAGQVNDIAAELSNLHDFELTSMPAMVTFPTDHLPFLFAGHTVVNLVAMERYYNVDPDIVAQLTRFGEGYGYLTVTILHTPLDEFHFIEATWPGMMNANLEAFVIFLEAILTGSFS